MVYERYIRDYIHVFNQLDREEWNYEDGCVLIGAKAMYEATGDRRYMDSIKQYIDRYVSSDGRIKGYDCKEYNLDRIPSGRVLFPLYEETREEKYRLAMEKLMAQVKTQPRTISGNFWHKQIYPHQIWLDGLYMGMPFYLRYEKLFGDEGHCLTDIKKQFEHVRQVLFDQETQLYYHAYDESKTAFWADKESGLSANFWLRAMGWYLMSLVDCYEVLDKDNGIHCSFFAGLLNEALDGILRYQDHETGLFYQLPALSEEPGNYPETSGSFMVAYALLKGVRLHMLEETVYRPRGEEILIALETRAMTLKDGWLSLQGICGGAGLGPAGNTRRDGSVYYYLNEPVVADEQKGAGVCMMAYSEWLKLKAAGRLESLGYPKVAIYNSGYAQFN